MLNRHNLAIASLVSKEESRFTLNGILVKPECTVETDGHQLIRVTTPAVNVAEFPQLPDGAVATSEFEPFILGAQDALDVARSIPKKVSSAVLANAAVLEGDKPRLVTTDLAKTRVFPVSPLSGNFPDYEQVIPKLEAAEFAICFDAALLRKVIKAVEDFRGDERQKPCRLYFSGPSSPLRIEATNGEGQEMTAVVMPMRDSVECALYEQRKKALELVKQFRQRVEGEPWIGVAAADLHRQSCELLDPPQVPEGLPEVVQIQASEEPEPEVIEPTVLETEEAVPEEQPDTGPRSWQPEQFCEKKWIPNGQRFATKEEAESAAENTFSRWMGSGGHRAMPSEDAVNYRWVDGRAEMLPAESIPAAEATVEAEKPQADTVTISYGSTPVGSFEVPAENVRQPLTGLRLAGNLVYGSGGQIVAKISNENGELRIGAHKSFEGDREQLREWVRTALELQKQASEAQPKANVTVSNLITLPSPKPVFERPANWNELSPAEKAWVTRRQKQGVAAAKVKPASVRDQLSELQQLLGMLAEKVGGSSETSETKEAV